MHIVMYKDVQNVQKCTIMYNYVQLCKVMCVKCAIDVQLRTPMYF